MFAPMKIVIPGGTSQVGGILQRAWSAHGHEVVVRSRHPEQLQEGVRHRLWDGRTIGPWAEEIDGADVVVNLAGSPGGRRPPTTSSTEHGGGETIRIAGMRGARWTGDPRDLAAPTR